MSLETAIVKHRRLFLVYSEHCILIASATDASGCLNKFCDHTGNGIYFTAQLREKITNQVNKLLTKLIVTNAQLITMFPKENLLLGELAEHSGSF